MLKKIIVGISGASGAIYGIRLLRTLKSSKNVESHLIISPAAAQTIKIETNQTIKSIHSLADHKYDFKDLAAAPSSGSFQTHGMVIIPCSIKTLSGIVNSYNDNLLTRAADVTLKEGRKLILSPRETPLHKGHLDLMSRFLDIGGVLIPPFPAFYHSPKTIEDIVDQTVGKILDQFEIEHQLFKRWS